MKMSCESGGIPVIDSSFDFRTGWLVGLELVGGGGGGGGEGCYWLLTNLDLFFVLRMFALISPILKYPPSLLYSAGSQKRGGCKSTIMFTIFSYGNAHTSLTVARRPRFQVPTS
jgi:hypothetical protein